jgi:glycosyltransferase involved in cell wall biosynthesis
VSAAGTGPLRLAFLGDGNSVHLREWLGYFASRGHEVTLLVPEAREVDEGLPAGISIERFVPFNHRKMRLVGALDARRSLRRILARIRPDVLEAQYLTVNGWHALMSGFHPYSVAVWGSDVLVTPRTSPMGLVYARLALRSADLVIGGSEALIGEAVRLGAPPGRVHAIPYGVDLTRFTPGPDPAGLRSRLGLEGRRVVFSPRAMRPLYRHGLVVEALARLPGDVAVVMVSYLADPVELESVRRRAVELGVSDRLIIVPSIDHSEMPDYYRLADVIVSLAASDSTPITLFEALACGRPVVAADLPAVREVMGRLDPASLVPAGDAAATAAALIRILDMPSGDTAAAAIRGEALVAEVADRQKNLRLIEDLYRALATTRRPARKERRHGI